MAARNVYRTELTPLSFLQRSADVFATKTAVRYGAVTYTYAELQDRVHRLASALKGAGMQPGDRVALLCPNIPPMLEAHYGVPLAGAVLVAINTRLSADEICYILNHSGAKLLVVDSELASLISPIRDQLGSVERIIEVVDAHPASGVGAVEYEAFLRSGSDAPIELPVEDEEATISINYTSGTTGRPKGVMYTHRGAYLNAVGEAQIAGLTSDSEYLWTLPMFHCNGWCFTWGVTFVGGTHVCLRRLDPAVVWQRIREGVTHLNGAPTVLISLVNHPDAPREPLGRPLTVTTAGAPPSPTIIGQVEALGAKIVHVYGLTETYGPHTVCETQPGWGELPPEQRARLKARQGQGYAIADLARVVDPSAGSEEALRDVPRDGQTMGEVVMRGNNVMKGYFNQPEATAEAFRGGWFHSGDLGVWHEDGYIELRDRKKDIIISGGENISTIEVEQAVARHPDVLEVAVIAVPDDHWGEVPKAFVVPKPGTKPTEASVIDVARQHLAHFKCPKYVEFGDLPQTSTGKIQKFVLREREWAGRDRRIN
ncbi:MAG: long-chain-fatty-acid--CoA ligase [Chloroflexi bacterium]|nr:long-chain-fatty-acid--CoA ligase [Chloroflexota bacterium]